jgi:CubicO group peptidase (beta-lactamase class C family)
MEVTTGQCARDLFQEHLFAPLEMKGARLDDMGMGAHLRALDLARLGQLLLNEGAYGAHTLFDESAMQELLPRPYENRVGSPGPDAAPYGLGIRWAGEPHPKAGKGDVPADATIFSKRTLGHGSFSGSIFRVDLDNDLVLAMGRFSSGERHAPYMLELMQTLMEALAAP